MTELLVRVECDCGTIAGILEGGIFPLCPSCGRRMMVPVDRAKAMAWAAALMPEQEAVKQTDEPSSRKRIYSDLDLAEKREAHGFPTVEQPWPRRSSPDGGLYLCPPWELAA